jgi:spore cortex formation protein SpoVR/YcgB (stage V sporulation)
LELDGAFERATLEKVFRLWGRPVHLETDEVTSDGSGEKPNAVRVVDSYDGEQHTSSTPAASA